MKDTLVAILKKRRAKHFFQGGYSNIALHAYAYRQGNMETVARRTMTEHTIILFFSMIAFSPLLFCYFINMHFYTQNVCPIMPKCTNYVKLP